MTKKELRKSISTVCREVMKSKQFRYVDIEVNYGLPYISVGMNGCEFYAQGEHATLIIDHVKKIVEKTDLTFNTCLICHLEDAGLFG